MNPRIWNAIALAIASAAGSIVSNPDIVAGKAGWQTWVVIAATAVLGGLRGPATQTKG